MESRSSRLPNFLPQRTPSTVWEALLMDSLPPAIMKSASPAMIW